MWAMYTSGIRKIYFPPAGTTIDAASLTANSIGYRAFKINDIIYLCDEERGWIETPFTVEDFSDE